jgi:hypothetical protein
MAKSKLTNKHRCNKTPKARASEDALYACEPRVSKAVFIPMDTEYPVTKTNVEPSVPAANSR